MPDQKKILVIDDEAGFRDLLRMHLSLAGYAVQVAGDGVEGGKALLEHSPDLVMSDINMPYLNGMELLSLIRSDERTARIPVILLSGHSDDETVSKAMNLGAADVLTKPVTRERLMESVRACLAKADSKAAAAQQSV